MTSAAMWRADQRRTAQVAATAATNAWVGLFPHPLATVPATAVALAPVALTRSHLDIAA